MNYMHYTLDGGPKTKTRKLQQMLFLFSSLDSCPHRPIIYLKLFFTLSVGGQLNGVVHSVSCNCSVSRNQPESTIPCTSSPGASTASVDDTRSILSNTPVAPALKRKQRKYRHSNDTRVMCIMYCVYRLNEKKN